MVHLEETLVQCKVVLNNWLAGSGVNVDLTSIDYCMNFTAIDQFCAEF